MPKEERRGSYCRFLCFRRWTPRPYKPPPANVKAAMKTNFRHSGSAVKEAQPRASRYTVMPEPPRASRASGGDDAYARARRLPCYAEYVNGVNGVNGAGGKDNGTAALFAACHVGDCALVEALLAAGFFLDARGDRNETALLVAARAGHADVVEFLFDSGIDMTARDVAGRNAADHARFAGHRAVADLLHEYGCPNVEVVD